MRPRRLCGTALVSLASAALPTTPAARGADDYTPGPDSQRQDGWRDGG